MSFSSAALLYLLISRLAILSTGVASMAIGYRLFCRGIGTGTTSNQVSTIESSIAGASLTLKNVAPGTAFALFGAVVICVMLVQSSPAFTWESTIQKLQSAATPAVQGDTIQSDKIQMRGEDQDAGSVGSLTKLGRELESRGKTVEAERAYRDAVTTMAEPMNDLAWIYLNSGRSEKALKLASLAVELRPDEARYTDTLSRARQAAKQ